MPRAKLTLTLPEGVWIGDVSRANPDARFRILTAIADEEGGVGLVEVTAPELPAVVAAIDAADTVSELEVLKRDDDEALVQFETSQPVLLLPVRGAGVPLEFPFDIREGVATWEVTSPADRLSALGSQLDAFGIDYTVEYVRQHVEDERLLTDRQRRLVVEAVDRGYYDTPRECSLTELAEAVGIAKSTCSETLHRAEGAIIKRFVEDVAPVDRLRGDGDDGRDATGPGRGVPSPDGG